MKATKGLILLISLLITSTLLASTKTTGIISGQIFSNEKDTICFATVYMKETTYGTATDINGCFQLEIPEGQYTMVMSAIGYKTLEQKVHIKKGQPIKSTYTLQAEHQQLDEVTVISKGIHRVRRSAYNAIAIDMDALQNSSSNLSEALNKAPGIRLRESGGVGSENQLTLDGFTGKHVKVFIDGVPQEGVGSSFNVNNLPISFAERIEVYKGVVPIGFGTDALGGVINIVTNKKKRRWFLDSSYSYGSFNTHKSHVHFGQTFKNGLTYEINAFQNYSDNSYYVDNAVKDFTTGATDNSIIEHVKRFHDTYHNEAVIGKFGFTDTQWADRFMLTFTFSNMYQDIQTGVTQDIVFGGKYRTGYSLIPSLEYHKRNLFTKGLDLTFTANYNRNMVQNVDTSSVEYNWRGETRPMKTPGEQSYQHSLSSNNNWNGTLTVNYRIGRAHLISFNHVTNLFHRNTQSLLTEDAPANAIPKETRKNISGLSYRLMLSEKWNVSAFGKYYNQFVAGPIATSTAQDEYVRTTRTVDAWGYGAAGTYFIIKGLQVKASYEKAYRLPTNEEMFGDEDLEMGDIGLRPENSDNVNLNISYSQQIKQHSFYVEGGLIYRNTKDYIQRTIEDLSGGKYGAAYENHGKVLTKGYNISLRYSFGQWGSVGGTFTHMDIRDNVKTVSAGSAQESTTYGARMPNIPYMYANSDISLHWPGLGGKKNRLSLTYDNQYLHSFPRYSEVIGQDSKYIIPTQFSHNITLSYSIDNGKYNLSFECRNISDEHLYDNFKLQKPGRAFYGKFRIYLTKQ